jgi:uncharacterized protein YndB with AHSA1/START domain
MKETLIDARPALALSRRLAAPVDRVWRAWTDPAAIRQWWGPGNEPVSLAELDVRVGGRFRIVFGGPDGRAHEVRGVYLEVIPNRTLAFTWTWPNSTPERESLVTVSLRPDGAVTRLEFRHEKFFNEAVRDDHERGWSAAFAKLEQMLGNH